MKKLHLIVLCAVGGLTAVGCGGPADEEPAVQATPPPAAQQATPDMLPPEQRARQGNEAGGPGEGS